AIELLCRGEVMAEGLLDDHASTLRTARLDELFHHRSEQQRWDREVVRRPARSVELVTDRLERRGIVVVTIDVTQQPTQRVEGDGVGHAVFDDTVVCPGPQLFERPTSFCYADDRHTQMASPDHRMQRRKDLLVGEVARGAEEHQGVRSGIAHCYISFFR